MKKGVLFAAAAFALFSGGATAGADGSGVDPDFFQNVPSLDRVLNDDLEVVSNTKSSKWKDKAQSKIKRLQSKSDGQDETLLTDNSEPEDVSVPINKIDAAVTGIKNPQVRVSNKKTAEEYFDSVESSVMNDAKVDYDPEKEYALSLNSEVNPKGYDSRISPTNWQVKETLSLKENLLFWCQVEGWDLVWDSEFDKEMDSSIQYSGNFLVALHKLFNDQHRSGSKFKATAYKGSKSLVVINDRKIESQLMTE